MNLTIWNLLTDLYDHTELADNFSALDSHDHSHGKGSQISTDGIADGAITSAKIASGVLIPPGGIGGNAGGDLSGSFPDPVVSTVNNGKTPLTTLTTAGGDLSGTYSTLHVNTVKGGQQPLTSTTSASGDLTGSYPGPTVHTVKNGQTPITNSTTAGGDLSGNYPSPTVAKLGGVAASGWVKAGPQVSDVVLRARPAGAASLSIGPNASIFQTFNDNSWNLGTYLDPLSGIKVPNFHPLGWVYNIFHASKITWSVTSWASHSITMQFYNGDTGNSAEFNFTFFLVTMLP